MNGLSVPKMTNCHNSTARKPLPRLRKRHRTTIYKWLRDRTSSVDYGVKYNDHPIHCNRNREVLDSFNGGPWLSRMTNEKFDAHFSGKKTFYFTGNGSSRSLETLVNIDIDCHETGTLEGAIHFAEFLKEHFFPNLYYEVSTNGNGVHGYVVVQKDGLAAEYLNPLLKRLEQHLRSILLGQDFDVENVEIKGTCPVFVWGERKGQLLNYQSGQLAKLPREADRFEELQQTTRISYLDLLKLPVVRKSTPLQNAPRDPVKQMAALPPGAVTGSITGKVISTDELAEIKGHYHYVAETLMNAHVLATKGRSVATVEDVAIYLMLLRFFTLNMNSDGTLPQSRFKGLWNSLFEAGDINRPFDDKRFAAIRNYLSSLGLLDWTNETYSIGAVGEDGRWKGGQACRWRAGELLMTWLDWGRAKKQSQAESDRGCAVHEEERGEGTSLAGTQISEAIQSLIRTADNNTLKPVLGAKPQLARISPEDIARYVPPFDEQLRLAA